MSLGIELLFGAPNATGELVWQVDDRHQRELAELGDDLDSCAHAVAVEAHAGHRTIREAVAAQLTGGRAGDPALAGDSVEGTGDDLVVVANRVNTRVNDASAAPRSARSSSIAALVSVRALLATLTLALFWFTEISLTRSHKCVAHDPIGHIKATAVQTARQTPQR